MVQEIFFKYLNSYRSLADAVLCSEVLPLSVRVAAVKILCDPCGAMKESRCSEYAPTNETFSIKVTKSDITVLIFVHTTTVHILY